MHHYRRLAQELGARRRRGAGRLGAIGELIGKLSNLLHNLISNWRRREQRTGEALLLLLLCTTLAAIEIAHRR